MEGKNEKIPSVVSMGKKFGSRRLPPRSKGVLTLDNQLSFAGRNQRPCDADITAAIQDELLWSFHVDGDRISVAVADWQAV